MCFVTLVQTMDRTYYEGLTVEKLKDLCRKEKITGFTGMKKKDIIDLIMNVKSGKPKGKVAKKAVSEEESPPVTKKPAVKQAAKKTAVPNVKITKRIETLKAAEDVLKGLYNEKELISKPVAPKNKLPPGRPSGILYVSLIENAMKNIKMYNEAGDQLKSIENAEFIKQYKDLYHFEHTLVAEMDKSIKSVLDTFGDEKIKKKILKKRSPFKKGDYKPVDILSVKIGKKGEEIPKGVKAPKKINITLDELRKELDNKEFIKEYTQSVRDLMNAKVELYQKRKAEVTQEYLSIDRKVKKLRAMGTGDHAIRDMYPGFDGLKVFIIDLEDLIELVRKRATSVTEESIKEGLMDAIDDPENGLSSIVGRDDVKNQLASQIYSFSKGYKAFIGSFNNIAIYGVAGTGKTRVAGVIAYALSKIGILARDTIKIVTRADLVGQYVGHTAPRTRSALIETLEGILFIDEAYQLTDCPETGRKDPFGSEAITEIVNFLDKYIGLNIVIVAGYEGVMTRCFMTFNEGLPRRFPYRYILSPYNDSELTDILISNLKKKLPSKIKLEEATMNFIFSLIVKIRTEIPDAFKNQAGDMLNLSSSLNKTIGSSFKIQWKPNNLENNIPIILSGFDDFLETKGYSLYD